jgi:polysaccharide biosynthesis protein PslG
MAAVLALPAGGSAAPLYGVSLLKQPPAEDYSRMAQGGVGAVRVVMSWPHIQPTQDGGYRWSNFDSLVSAASAAGVEVLPILYGSPSWAVDCGGLSESECRRAPPLGSRKARRAWQDFLTAAVERYGPEGSFWQPQAPQPQPPLPQVAEVPGPAAGVGPAPGAPAPYSPIEIWQVWNEPSSPTYWKPEPDANRYAKLVRLSAEALRGADSDATVLLAGLFGTPFGGQDPSLLAWRYLNRLYEAKGIKRDFDAVALHPYAPTLRGVEIQVRKARKVMKRHNDSRTEVWITEIGWGSSEEKNPLLKGLEGQKRMLRKSFNLLTSRRGWRIEAIVWFDWRDPGEFVEGCTSPFCLSAGLFDEDGNPKPAWNAYTSFAGGTP